MGLNLGYHFNPFLLYKLIRRHSTTVSVTTFFNFNSKNIKEANKTVASGKKDHKNVKKKILSNCQIHLNFEPFYFLINNVLLRKEHVKQI